MSTTGSKGKRAPADAALNQFEVAFGRRPDWVSRAPGRVNLIGGHIDYNGGLVLPAAVSLHVAVAFRPSEGRRLRIYSADFDERAEFEIDELMPGSVPGWAAYPAGVAWSLSQTGLAIRGVDAAVSGNLPIGGGLSSSAALEVAFAAALRQSWELDIPDLRLAQFAQTAENQFVGVDCGIMDQVTATCAESDHAILLDCRSLELRQIPLPAGLRIVILNSGVNRELRDSGYNRRRRECEEALSRIAAIDDDVHSLRDLRPDQLNSLLRHLPPPLDRRVRHVVGEIERVQLAASALEQSETERFGELMFASHRSSQLDYQVSIDELDSLVELARQAPGVVGARLTGAGFGGCTVNLVSAALVEDFVEYVSKGYRKLHGIAPDTHVSEASRGVTLERV